MITQKLYLFSKAVILRGIVGEAAIFEIFLIRKYLSSAEYLDSM
ncbi:hypothetical protein [Candidatus Symbiopectobacterium sp.]|nr:hypothetical protein [Candidatus Symbiopectobacterium sp.]